MNARIILVAIAATFLLSGCDFAGYGLVMKSALDEAITERDGFKKKLEELQKNPPKPEEVLMPPTAASCKALIDAAVVNKSCQVATPAPVKKAIVTKRPVKPVYVNKQASGGATLPSPPVAVATATASATAGTAHAEAQASVNPQKEESKVAKEVLDRCIFRVQGIIKSEAYLANGKTACPIWRDKQLELFKQNPNDQIWSKVYPSN
jgi:hypothetical protein